jgi:hypothetical protein
MILDIDENTTDIDIMLLCLYTLKTENKFITDVIHNNSKISLHFDEFCVNHRIHIRDDSSIFLTEHKVSCIISITGKYISNELPYTRHIDYIEKSNYSTNTHLEDETLANIDGIMVKLDNIQQVINSDLFSVLLSVSRFTSTLLGGILRATDINKLKTSCAMNVNAFERPSKQQLYLIVDKLKLMKRNTNIFNQTAIHPFNIYIRWNTSTSNEYILIVMGGVTIFCESQIERFKYQYHPGLNFMCGYLICRNKFDEFIAKIDERLISALI